MKTLWIQTLAWIAAVAAAILLAFATPDESSIEKQSAAEQMEMTLRHKAGR